MTAVTHPRVPPRRGGGAGTWWSKAVLRAVEEAAYAEADLRRGRALARAGAVGAITVDDGSAVAAVTDGDEAMAVTVTVPVLDPTSAQTFVEIVAAGAGRIAALLSGELPHPLVEDVEEAGVELLPYGGELGSACSCDAWLDPCPHALAVLTQLAWLIRADPFVLTHLRGFSRDTVLRGLHALTTHHPDRHDPAWQDAGLDPDDDLAVAQDAAARAQRAVDLLAQGRPLDDLI
jgi:uncharacterized Zn finger protein